MKLAPPLLCRGFASYTKATIAARHQLLLQQGAPAVLIEPVIVQGGLPSSLPTLVDTRRWATRKQYLQFGPYTTISSIPSTSYLSPPLPPSALARLLCTSFAKRRCDYPTFSLPNPLSRGQSLPKIAIHLPQLLSDRHASPKTTSNNQPPDISTHGYLGSSFKTATAGVVPAWAGIQINGCGVLSSS